MAWFVGQLFLLIVGAFTLGLSLGYVVMRRGWEDELEETVDVEVTQRQIGSEAVHDQRLDELRDRVARLTEQLERRDRLIEQLGGDPGDVVVDLLDEGGGETTGGRTPAGATNGAASDGGPTRADARREPSTASRPSGTAARHRAGGSTPTAASGDRSFVTDRDRAADGDRTPDRASERAPARSRRPRAAEALAEPDVVVLPEVEAAPTRTAAPERPSPAPPQEPVATPAEPDDLTAIDGVGPKMHGALQAAGFTTFAALAGATEDDIRAAIETAGMRFAPTAPTWPAQARELARQGRDGAGDDASGTAP